MDIMAKLSAHPQSGLVNQQMLTVRLSLEAAQHDNTVREKLLENPGAYLASAGYPLSPDMIPDFNRFIHNDTSIPAILGQLQSGEGLTNLEGLRCTMCKVAAYGIAAALVAIGAAGLATLSVSSGIVLALAAFAGVSAAGALAFIAGLASVISGGVSAVSGYICSWTGACS